MADLIGICVGLMIHFASACLGYYFIWYLPSRRQQAFELNNPSSAKSGSSSQDVVIAVIGASGSGKTSFVKTVSGQADIQVGNDLLSDTFELKTYRFSHKSVDYVLVDTPGFNHAMMSNREVVTMIIQWLGTFYDNTRDHLDGIICIHDITRPRLEGSTMETIQLFRQLTRGNPSSSFTLATSFWDRVLPSIGASREREIVQSRNLWRDMISKGSDVARIWPDRPVCLQVLEQAGMKRHAEQSASETPDGLIENFHKIGLEKNSIIQEVEARMASEIEAEKKRYQSKLEANEVLYRRERDILCAKEQENIRAQQQMQRDAAETDIQYMEIERLKQQQELRKFRHDADIKLARVKQQGWLFGQDELQNYDDVLGQERQEDHQDYSENGRDVYLRTIQDAEKHRQREAELESLGRVFRAEMARRSWG